MRSHFAGGVVFDGAIEADVDEAFYGLDALVGAVTRSHLNHSVRRTVASSFVPAYFEALASFLQVEEQHPCLAEQA